MGNITLKCEKCSCEYKKPEKFREYLQEDNCGVFFKWSLKYCDTCRREKEVESLKALPKILEILSENK